MALTSNARENREAEFAACLLVTGPPEFPPPPRNHRSSTLQPYTLGYRYACERWWTDYVIGDRVALYARNAFDKQAFLNWYEEYKQWIRENTNGYDTR